MSLVDFISSTDKQGQLMLAYAQGDAAAFTELYTQYKAEMFRFFLRQCGNRALAEELYQELWMRVISNRQAYEHKARFSTWLYHIAHNLCRDHFRKFEPDNDEEALENVEAGASADPLEQYSSQDKISRFLMMLQTLPDEQRQVFLLKEEGGLSLEQIARVTGASFETVKSRLRYAVKKLRQVLEDAA